MTEHAQIFKIELVQIYDENDWEELFKCENNLI